MGRNREMVDLPEGVVLHTPRGVFKGKAPKDLVEKAPAKPAPAKPAEKKADK